MEPDTSIKNTKFAGGNCRIKTFGFVSYQPNLFGVLAREFRDVLISGGQAFSAIHHDNGSIGLFQRANGLIDHEFFNADLATGHATANGRAGERVQHAAGDTP